MSTQDFVRIRSGQAIGRARVPLLDGNAFRGVIKDAVDAGQRVAALFADASPDTVELYAVLADNARAILRVGRTALDSDHVPSLTPACPQLHLFEREIAEQY